MIRADEERNEMITQREFERLLIKNHIIPMQAIMGEEHYNHMLANVHAAYAELTAQENGKPCSDWYPSGCPQWSDKPDHRDARRKQLDELDASDHGTEPRPVMYGGKGTKLCDTCHQLPGACKCNVAPKCAKCGKESTSSSAGGVPHCNHCYEMWLTFGRAHNFSDWLAAKPLPGPTEKGITKETHGPEYMAVLCHNERLTNIEKRISRIEQILKDNELEERV